MRICQGCERRRLPGFPCLLPSFAPLALVCPKWQASVSGACSISANVNICLCCALNQPPNAKACAACLPLCLSACLHMYVYLCVCVSVLGGHLKYRIFFCLLVARQIPRRKRKLANDLSETRASKICKRDNAAYACYLIFLTHTHTCVYFS